MRQQSANPFALPIGIKAKRSLFGIVFLIVAVVFPVACVHANPGYEPDSAHPTIGLSATIPLGIAIDQTSQEIYVAELSADLHSLASGQVEQLSLSGDPTADSPFLTGADDLFLSVAVNPATHDVYAYQGEVSEEIDQEVVTKGTYMMSTFSSTGTVGTSFNPGASFPSLAADGSGRIFFPDTLDETVLVFNSAGALTDTITCAGCPGGAFDRPKAAAVDGAGNLYVVDVGKGRAIKFKPSGGTYVYDSILQSGDGAVAVGVDPATNEVFVGDLDASGYHVVAFDPSGNQIDDFGGGLFGQPVFDALGGGQIAVAAATHEVYVTDPSQSGNAVRVFERVASIPAPSATTLAASLTEQVKAVVEGSVNPNGHGLLDCHIEYASDANFDVNGFASATLVPCSSRPRGSSNVAVTAQLGGLTPGVVYDYRLVASNNGGQDEGQAQQLTTLPPLPPAVTTGAASATGKTEATVNATVNARGGPISNCHFEYVKEADFQESGFANAIWVACSPKPRGTADVPVSANLSFLHPDTDYRFRGVATNNSGAAAGLDRTFTIGQTCTSTPELCPPPAQPPVPVAPSSSQSPASPVLGQPSRGPTEKALRCRGGFKKKRSHGKLRCVRVKKRHANRMRFSTSGGESGADAELWGAVSRAA